MMRRTISIDQIQFLHSHSMVAKFADVSIYHDFGTGRIHHKPERFSTIFRNLPSSYRELEYDVFFDEVEHPDCDSFDYSEQVWLVDRENLLWQYENSFNPLSMIHLFYLGNNYWLSTAFYADEDGCRVSICHGMQVRMMFEDLCDVGREVEQYSLAKATERVS